MSWWRLIIINNKYEKCFLFLLAWCWGKIRWTPLIAVKKSSFFRLFSLCSQTKQKKKETENETTFITDRSQNFEWKCEINCCCRCRCRHRHHHHFFCRYRTHHLVKGKSHPLQDTFCSKICFFKVQTSRRAEQTGPRLHTQYRHLLLLLLFFFFCCTVSMQVSLTPWYSHFISKRILS